MSASSKSSAAPAAAAATSEPSDPRDDLVSVFNRSPKGGDVIHHVYRDVRNSEGKIVRQEIERTYRVQAGTFGMVPQRIAELWKRQMPKTIIDGQDAGAPESSEKKSAEHVRLEQKNAELERRLEGMEKMLADLRGSHL